MLFKVEKTIFGCLPPFCLIFNKNQGCDWARARIVLCSPQQVLKCRDPEGIKVESRRDYSGATKKLLRRHAYKANGTRR